MKKLKFVLVLLCLSLFILGCKATTSTSDEPTPQPQTPVLVEKKPEIFIYAQVSFDDEIYTFEYDSEVSSKAKLIVKNTQDNTESPSEVDDSKFILFADEDFIPVDYTGKTWAQALKSRLEYEGDMIYTA